MKTTKLVIGIISIVLFLFIMFQSCAVGIGNALSDDGETSGSVGVLVGFCMLIAGIVGIAARSGVAGGFVSGGFYAFGGIIGILGHGSYSDLVIWSVLCLIFAAVFIIGTALTKKDKAVNEAKETAAEVGKTNTEKERDGNP